jgi:hypothetical protein
MSGASNADASASTFIIARWMFLRLLGIVYLAAFLSLWVQIEGLVGSHGILPVRDCLAAVEQRFPSCQRFYLFPTLCWIDASDPWLRGQCLAGAALSGLLIVGIAPVPVLLLLWLLYLSLTTAGQVFLGYQWDTLLLETGLLAIFFAPLQLWPRLAGAAPPSLIAVWLFRWLLFRLMFMSGAAKLLSGDPTWRNLTALKYHYETQPLPTWTSWSVHQLPGWFQALSVLFTFAAELLVPLGIFGPRPCRQVACAGIVGLQLLIAATGNYGFFNLLTIALCIPLLDDAFFPAGWRSRFGLTSAKETAPRGRAWSNWLLSPLAAVIVFFTLLPFLDKTGVTARSPAFFKQVRDAVDSLQSINTYGLFSVMTTRRPEIIIEGSNDGKTWRAYEFCWKPGNVLRRPRFSLLHLPRLDWQMWFAALGEYDGAPWFYHFMTRLLEGSPQALDLLEHNPFPEAPPRYLRAVLYDYHFTDRATRRETGAWWRARPLGLYAPVLRRTDALDDL